MKIQSSAALNHVNTNTDGHHAAEIKHNGPVELDLIAMKLVAGGLPRSGWGSASAIVELPRSGW